MTDSAPPAPPTTAAPPVARTGKTIVLFSDGTGNSSAKLFKTNVWRMYEAVDLGPTPPDRRPQIAYYDDGVGTSGFKPLAVLGGVFGYGLKRNVLDIYKYACRNYQPGDDIYAFGFSRGAFTIRLLVALILKQGLVPSNDEAELERRSRDAYRAYRQRWLPRRLAWPTRACRRVRDTLTRWWDDRRGHARYETLHRAEAPVRFLGVWDTVSAYGGPISELTRAIDNWIFPLSMPDYHLNAKVQCARHAVALDDERDAFQPLLWDEIHEETLIAQGAVGQDRLQQLWFTGMHSDVGGGYPDESLSYVSLLWMMEEAKNAGLRTLHVIKDRYVALANSGGPIHDSRMGLAAYYRFQPRRIAAWLEPVDERTYGLRDPELTNSQGRQQGLLRAVKVHESVIARIANGTDRYAPLTLPEAFEILPPQVEGENIPQADESAGEQPRPADPAQTPGAQPRQSLLSRALRARLMSTDAQHARGAAFEAVWDLVWRRRVAYFVTVGFTCLLATMPAWIGHAPEAVLMTDGRTWIDAPLRAAGALLPAFLGSWIDTFAANPLYFLILIACIYAGLRYGAACEQRLRDRARHIWHAAATVDAPLPPAAPDTRLRGLRNSTWYQRSVQTIKWRVLPDYVILATILLAGAWATAAGVTQAYLPWMESGATFCAGSPGNLPELVRYQGTFEAQARCHPVSARVMKGRRYHVALHVVKPWFDGHYPTSPLGMSAAELGAPGFVGAPFRRVIEGNYLQPVIEIRRPLGAWRIDSLHMLPLAVAEQTPGVFAGEFTATQEGELFVFVNDAVLPGWPTFFYESMPARNQGTADLRIVRLNEADAAAAR